MSSLITPGSFWQMMKRFLFAGVVGTLFIPQANAQSANGNDVSKKEAQLAILQSLDGTPALGDPNARIVIVEFGDYQCPFCGQHANQVLPQILADYVKSGKIRYFFKDIPVEAIHPQAFKAAEAALCSGEQGKYWEMHDRLFKNQRALTVRELSAHAAVLDLDIGKFQQCLDGDTYATQIRKSVQDGLKAGVRGTPTFFIGR